MGARGGFGNIIPIHNKLLVGNKSQAYKRPLNN